MCLLSLYRIWETFFFSLPSIRIKIPGPLLHVQGIHFLTRLHFRFLVLEYSWLLGGAFYSFEFFNARDWAKCDPQSQLEYSG